MKFDIKCYLAELAKLKECICDLQDNVGDITNILNEITEINTTIVEIQGDITEINQELITINEEITNITTILDEGLYEEGAHISITEVDDIKYIASIPYTLQEITDTGNTTDDDIISSASFKIISDSTSSSFLATSLDGLKRISLSAVSTPSLTIQRSFGNSVKIGADNIGGSKLQQFPNANGTLAISITLNDVLFTTDTDGNINLGAVDAITPNFQEVTDVGNDTTNPVVSTNSFNVVSNSTSTGFYARSTDSSKIAVLSAQSSPFLSLQRSAGNVVNLKGDNITSTKNIQLPNISGVLTSTITFNSTTFTTDSSGNINLGSSIIGIPNLQEVTDEGNQTDNSMISESGNYSATISPTSFKSLEISSGDYTAIEFDSFILSDTNKTSLKRNPTSSDIVLNLPNAATNSTLVTSIEGVLADSTGEVDFGFTTGSVLFAGATTHFAQDNANFYWNDTTNRLALGARSGEPDVLLSMYSGDLRVHQGNLRVTNGAVNISANEAHNASAVNILTPTNINWVSAITIDQPNMRMYFQNGNADGLAGISKPNTLFGANEGILKIFSNAVTSGGLTGQAIIAFETDAALKGIINELGWRWQKYITYDHEITSVTNEIPDGGFAVYKNTDDNSIKLVARDGSTMVEVGGLTDINGLISNGTNVSITGTGTIGDPYVINASGGGSGSGTVDTSPATNRLGYYISATNTISPLAAITANSVLISNSSGLPVAASTSTYPSLTELAFVKGVTSSIQGQFTTINSTLGTKQTTLVSGTNIKTIRGTTILGSGDIDNGLVNSGAINRLVYYGAAGNAVSNLAAITGSRILVSDINGLPIAADTSTYPTLTELSYVKGVTSSIQTQFSGKQGTITLTTSGTSGAATLIGNTLNIPQYTGGSGSGTVSSGSINRLAYYNAAGTTVDDLAAITASRILLSDSNGLPIAADTATYPSLSELAFVKGVTSSIQTQIGTINTTLSGKQNTITLTTTGSSGPATLVGSTLNIPQYGGGTGSGTVNTSAGANRLAYYVTATNAVDDLAAITANMAIISDANGLPIASTVTANDLVLFKRNHTQQALTDGATISMNCANGHIGTVTINGNRSISFTGITAWHPVKLIVTQGVSGNYTLTFPTGSVIPLGFGSGDTLNLSTLGGAIDFIEVLYTGSAYLITIAKNFV